MRSAASRNCSMFRSAAEYKFTFWGLARLTGRLARRAGDIRPRSATLLYTVIACDPFQPPRRDLGTLPQSVESTWPRSRDGMPDMVGKASAKPWNGRAGGLQS